MGRAQLLVFCCVAVWELTLHSSWQREQIMCVDCRRGRARGKGLTDSQSQCPWPLPLPCRPHSRLTDPVGEGREPLSSGSLLRPQRTTPHPDHPARFLGFSFPKSRMELTASEGSLKDAGGDQWTEPTTPASPGDSAAASMRPGGSRKKEAGSWGVQATTPPGSPAHVGSPTAPRLCRQPGWGYRGPGSPESRGPSSRHTLASGSVCSAESLSDTRSPVPALFEPDLSDFSSLFWQR